MSTKYAFLMCIFSFVLIIPCIGFCQIPGYHIFPYDSLVFEDTLISTFKIINFNEDEYLDYYIATTDRSYLIDGASRDTLWMSNHSSNKKYENLEYIESSGAWRCFIVEYLPDAYNNFRLKTVDIPGIIPQDSIDIYLDEGYSYGPFIAGYLPFQNESYYVHIDYHLGTSDEQYHIGKLFIFNSSMDSLLTSFEHGKFPTSHYFIEIDDNDYFIIVGNYEYHWYHSGGAQIYWGIGHLYNGNFEVISSFTPVNLAAYFLSSDIIYDSLNNTYKLLLAGAGKIITFLNVLDNSQYLYISIPLTSNYAKYINIEGEVKIISASNIGYMELLNADLSFLSYIFEDINGGLKNIQTEDIDFDGTDELFCLYDSMIVIYKLDDGVDIDDPSTALPIFFITNHPNPFNATTTIQFHLPEPGHVTIDIFNLLGQNVSRLIDSPLPAGNHQVTWDAGDLPSGMYFYRIQAGDYIQTEKMLLLK